MEVEDSAAADGVLTAADGVLKKLLNVSLFCMLSNMDLKSDSVDASREVKVEASLERWVESSGVGVETSGVEMGTVPFCICRFTWRGK